MPTTRYVNSCPRQLLTLLAVLLVGTIVACTATTSDSTAVSENSDYPIVAAAAATPTPEPAPALVGPRPIYLALGDSLAYGVQPNLTLNQGYADALFARLRVQGATQIVNFACPGESSVTMLDGGCPMRPLRKVRYEGSQIDAAVAFITENRGQVSPVTLTLGVNDVINDIGPGCREQRAAFADHLEAMATNLDVIVGRLTEALAGQGDLIVTLYYNPFESACPNTAAYVTQVNSTIAEAARRHGALVADATADFAGRTCELTWFCTRRDTHANTAGYQLIADAILGLLP